MELLFLGTGTSYGVPMIGCDCAVCRSSDPRDRRMRASVLVNVSGGNILIDTATDLHVQALHNKITRVDAILFTHSHADHMHGIDEVRRFCQIRGEAIPVYGDAETISYLIDNHGYIFSDPNFHLGWGIPRLVTHEFTTPAMICDVKVIPVPVLHGERPILGYRIGKLAYITDCSYIPEASISLLEGLDTLVIGALRHRPHPTHFNISGALEVVESLKPRKAYFTHIAHDLAHAETEANLPEHIRLAYDGLKITIPD